MYRTPRGGQVIDFWIVFKVTIVVRRFIREAWPHHHWET
jgi:hypothetical protein